MILSERKELTNWLICLFSFLSTSTSKILSGLRSSVSDNPRTLTAFSGGQHLSRRYRKREVKCFPKDGKCYSQKHVLRIMEVLPCQQNLSAAWIVSDRSAHELFHRSLWYVGPPEARGPGPFVPKSWGRMAGNLVPMVWSSHDCIPKAFSGLLSLEVCESIS